MQSLQSSGLQPMMSMEEFLSQVAWLGVQPSPSGGGEAFTTQEPKLPPSEPFIIETDPVAQEEAAAQEPISLVPISPAPITNDSQPSAPASEPEQPILQDPPTAPVLDLNDHAEDD